MRYRVCIDIDGGNTASYWDTAFKSVHRAVDALSNIYNSIHSDGINTDQANELVYLTFLDKDTKSVFNTRRLILIVDESHPLFNISVLPDAVSASGGLFQYDIYNLISTMIKFRTNKLRETII